LWTCILLARNLEFGSATNVVFLGGLAGSGSLFASSNGTGERLADARGSRPLTWQVRQLREPSWVVTLGAMDFCLCQWRLLERGFALHGDSCSHAAIKELCVVLAELFFLQSANSTRIAQVSIESIALLKVYQDVVLTCRACSHFRRFGPFPPHLSILAW